MTKARNSRVRTLAVAAISLAGLCALAACERQPEEPAKVATHAIEVPGATTPAGPAEAPAAAEQSASAEAKTTAPAPAAKPTPAKAQGKPAAEPAPKPQPQPQSQDHSGHDMSSMPNDSHSGH